MDKSSHILAFMGGGLVAYSVVVTALASINVVNRHWATGPVTTWMGDCLWAGKPSGYITSHLGKLSVLFSVG